MANKGGQGEFGFGEDGKGMDDLESGEDGSGVYPPPKIEEEKIEGVVNRSSYKLESEYTKEELEKIWADYEKEKVIF